MKKLNQNGLTLIEVLVSSALFALISISAYSMMMSFVRRQDRTQKSASITLIMNSAIDELRRRIGNSVVLSPPEGLEVPADGFYPGIATTRGGISIVGCTREEIDGANERFSILRFTSFDYKVSPESTRRPWNDANFASQEVRVSHHPPDFRPPHLFQTAQFGSPEVLLIDADRLTMRRFRVTSTAEVLNSSLDPYDDLPKTDGGVSLVFDYRRLSLAMPTALNGANQTPSGQNYITGSSIYPVHTYYLCRSPEGKIVLKEEATGRTTQLIDPAPFFLSLSKFEIRFHGTKDSDRLEHANFQLFPYTDFNQRLCINNVSLEIELTPLPGSSSKPENLKTLIPLQTFNTRRPAVCL